MDGSHLPGVSRPEISAREESHGTSGTVLLGHRGNRVAGVGEVHKMHGPPGTVKSPSQSPEQFRPRKGTNAQPIWVYAPAEHPRT